MLLDAGKSHLHDIDYIPPKERVLLLTCMDLRLMDNTLLFMNHDNLVNRYDHVVFAGAALGALGAPGAVNDKGEPVDFSHWNRVFQEHLAAAVELHGVRDVYILEHRNCGAYHQVFRVAPEFGLSEAEQRREAKCHWKYARQLEQWLKVWGQEHNWPLRTHKFLMDLRGHVSVLRSPKGK